MKYLKSPVQFQEIRNLLKEKNITLEIATCCLLKADKVTSINLSARSQFTVFLISSVDETCEH